MTLPDDKSVKKSGRIYLDEFAQSKNIPLIKINHINDQSAIDAIKEHNIDWLFIIGWSQIASKEVINATKIGAIGAHPTLLPEGRGRAAIPWAILKGLDKTGVTFFKMDEGVDTGLILGQEEVPIASTENATTLYSKVNKAHEILIKKLYPQLLAGTVTAHEQNEANASYWEGRKPADGLITQDMTMLYVDRLVRATSRPYPGAFIQNDKIKVIFWSGFTSKKAIIDELYYEFKLNDGYFYSDDFESVIL
ncbi:methionyl-tRNA formyltransferase [Nonlabens dokdonensis DSW-6]|uniref:Methionyl-tRNA formyltransferase n=2 Tax=Nonlabens dokdonensis TaxID=328515 RepID=L7WEE9_NONDD|nr:methionyl-tRNA formyltransferase [Nonlabens dokdonensis DSW-6]